ncbi:outer membrane beta-barrel protein [Flavobacterium branchiarum]|uniref:Outer membrane beta-barrel protein n=1 Tax=Flavobacterium branchiarum TaxID=1114870 RepID=A0ABV5FM33_9FLAO|nr:outer membrane beta-barrel protein [Flavobacterium branchiarum]MDN3674603.1 outer membrane beta-barrel protein [Flavobacterium branchiarum]
MKKHLLLLLIIFLGFNTYSQITFEKGYYIDNSGQKIDCLIKNVDWRSNPTTFEYKLSEESESRIATINTVKEFAIENGSKYISSIVKIDKSSTKLDEMSSEKNPVFVEEQLFLKVLIEGKANLFVYNNSASQKFFYKVDNGNLEQLVYKKYLISTDKIAQNEYYKQQLWKDLQCSTIEITNTINLQYKEKDLIKLFIQYNECSNSSYTNYVKKIKKDLFNLSIRPRLNSTTMSNINPISFPKEIDFENKLSLRIGLEAEFILPFNRNKWAVTIEPTYQNYKSEGSIDVSQIYGNKLFGKVEYSSIQVPLSVRHYFFLNNRSKLFANISYVYNFNLNKSFEYTRADGAIVSSQKDKSKSNLGFGAGYKFMDKYSLEVRYEASKELLSEYSIWQVKYSSLSVIFGYTLF